MKKINRMLSTIIMASFLLLGSGCEIKQKEQVEYIRQTYNYLAIGNSMALHGYADYWWDDDRGMASSSDDKDYVHLITAYLETIHPEADVVMQVKNGYSWTGNDFDRAEQLTQFDEYLSEDVDLITVQLGENTQNLDTWEKDFETLLKYLQEKAPNAEIYVIGDFWEYENRDELKEEAAIACGVTYISLEGIKDNPIYQAGIGTVVEGKDPSETHVIEHSGVAAHPGDAGMAAIAYRTNEAIGAKHEIRTHSGYSLVKDFEDTVIYNPKAVKVEPTTETDAETETTTTSTSSADSTTTSTSTSSTTTSKN